MTIHEYTEPRKSVPNETKEVNTERIIKSDIPTEKSQDDESTDGVNCAFSFGHRTRYFILLSSFLCLSICLSNILTLNFTLICWEKPAEIKPTRLNYTIWSIMAPFSDIEERFVQAILHRKETKDDYLKKTAGEKTALLMSVAIGAMVAVYPLIWLLNKFGPRRLFFVIGILSATSTALFPLAAKNPGSDDIYYMVLCRVVQGVALAACLPVVGQITAHWSTLKQSGFFVAILSSFMQTAPVMTMPLGGLMCETHGWASVYYIHSAATVFFFSIFVIFYRDAPRKHQFVSVKELLKILHGKEETQVNTKHQVPYAKIMKSGEIWAVWIAAFGNFMGTQLLLQYTPIYLKTALQVKSLVWNGVISALPPFSMFLVKIAAGLASDRIDFLSEKAKLRLFNTLALGGMCLSFATLAFIPDPLVIPNILLIILSNAILGFNSGGFFKSAQLVARQYSTFVMGNVSFLNCFCMLLVPFIVGQLTDNDNIQWSTIFTVHAAILFFTNGLYCFRPGYKAAPWTKPEATFAEEPKESLNNYKTQGQPNKATHRRSLPIIPSLTTCVMYTIYFQGILTD